MEQEEFLKKWSRIVAKAWADEDYKARLLADPAAVLAEEGVAIPEGVALTVVENTPTHMHLVLPPVPADAAAMEMTEERKAAFLFGIFAGPLGILDVIH
ncbi:MAG: hypothetical protein QG656_1279 [Candidatus Hydrogenedentes bacterium]|nr:hypothetical protein [Candidatus Hydrogenedentota bacterium]